MRSLFSCLSILFALVLISSPASAEQVSQDFCPAAGTVYKDLTALSPEVFTYVVDGTYHCQVKCTGICISTNGSPKLLGTWKYTSYGFDFSKLPTNKFYSYTVKYGANAGMTIRSNKANDFCAKEVNPSYPYDRHGIDSFYFSTVVRLDHPDDDVSLPAHPGANICYVYRMNRTTGLLNYNSQRNFSIHLPFDTVDIPPEVPICKLGEFYDSETNLCQLIPRVEKESCFSNTKYTAEGHLGSPQHIDVNGCHFYLFETKHFSDSFPPSCHTSTYYSDGMASRSSDYVFKKPGDFCSSDFTPPKCLDGMQYSYDAGICYGDGKTSYDPNKIDSDKNSALDCSASSDGLVTCSDKDGAAPSPSEPDPRPPVDKPLPSGDSECIRINGYDFCSSVSTGQPLGPDNYPFGSEVDPKLCQNGYLGSNCSHNWQNGGYPSIDDNFGDSITVGDLSEFFSVDPSDIGEIDYDSVGDDLERNPISTDLLYLNRFMTTDGFSGSYTCPEPEEFVFFPGTQYEAVYMFEFTVPCQIGDEWKNVYLGFFVFMLFISLVRGRT